MISLKVFTVKSVDKASGAPALAATSTVSTVAAARSSPGHGPEPVSLTGTLASATLRFRVSGSVMFMVTTAGIGKGVSNGTSTKLVEVSEMVYSTDMAASDKIGITI